MLAHFSFPSRCTPFKFIKLFHFVEEKKKIERKRGPEELLNSLSLLLFLVGEEKTQVPATYFGNYPHPSRNNDNKIFLREYLAIST